jgi:hypothetical protein
MTLSGNYLSKESPFLPELLRGMGYNTYAEVTGPLLPEVGISRGFDYYNYRNSKDYYLTSDWGTKLRDKFISGHFKKPWFVLLHFWELHHPRQILYFNKNMELYESFAVIGPFSQKVGKTFGFIEYDNCLNGRSR